jgi:hypothetical protein
MLKKIFSLLLLSCLSHQICSQVIMERLSSVKANNNFDFEIRGSLDGKMDLFVLRVNPDSAENFVVFIRTQKVLDAFYRYLLCFRYRCFKDDQPIFFQGQRALMYDYPTKIYTDSRGNQYFSRKNLIGLLKTMDKNKKILALPKKFRKRKKYFFH